MQGFVGGSGGCKAKAAAGEVMEWYITISRRIWPLASGGGALHLLLCRVNLGSWQLFIHLRDGPRAISRVL